MKEERDQRPRWLSDYFYTNINSDSLPIAAISVIQYGRYLDRLIREFMIADLVHCSLRSVNKKTTYKPTYVRKNVPEATRKKIDMASNGQ